MKGRASLVLPVLIPIVVFSIYQLQAVHTQVDARSKARVIAVLDQKGEPEEIQARLDALGFPLVEILLELTNADEHRFQAESALIRIGAAAVPILLERLQEGSRTEAARSLRILARIDDPRKFEPIWESIRDGQGDLAFTALQWARQISWPKDFWTPARLEPVIELTRHPSVYRAVQAVELLATIGDIYALDQLRIVLSDAGGLRCQRFEVAKVWRAISRVAHAGVLDLLSAFNSAQCMGAASEAEESDAAVALSLDPNPGTDSLIETIRAWSSQFRSGRPQFNQIKFSQLLVKRIAENASPQLLPALRESADNRLLESRIPDTELEALALFSPAQARSAAVEMASRFAGENATKLLVELQEPQAVQVLVNRLKSETKPEDWYLTAQSLASIMSGTPIEDIRSFLQARGISGTQIDAVVQAVETPVAEEASHFGQWRVQLPRDFAMLSVMRPETIETRPDLLRLHLDRLASSSALLAAIEKNADAALAALIRSAPASESAGADFVWTLSKIPSEAATRLMRERLSSAGPDLPMVSRELGRRRDRASIPHLLTQLDSEEDLVCAAAAWALGKLDATEAIPLLRRELDRRRDRFVQRDLVEAIIRLEGDRAALDLIAREDLSPGTRDFLFYPLARLGGEGLQQVLKIFEESLPEGPDSMPAGRALLASRRLPAVLEFIRILLQHGELFEAGGYSITQVLLPYLAEHYQGPELVQPLAEMAAHPQFEAWVTEGLVKQPGEFADQVIREALTRGAGPSRFTEYLAQRPIPSLGPHLKMAYLAHEKKSWDLRALVTSGSPEGIEVVRQLLEHPQELGGNAWTRVAEALYRTPQQEGWDLLPQIYQQLEERDLYFLLLEVPDRPAKPAIVQFLTKLLDRQESVSKATVRGRTTFNLAEAAAFALDRLDAAEAIEELQKYWDRRPVRVGSVMLLSRHPSRLDIDNLFELIREQDFAAWRRVEIALVDVLRKQPEKLNLYLDENNRDVRRKVAAIATEIPHPIADRALLQLASDPDPYVRSQAIAAMERGPSERFSPSILEALHDPDPIVRLEAIRVSGVLGIAAAAPVLESVLTQPDDPQAGAAARAIALVQGRESEAVLSAAAALASPNLAAIRELGRLEAEGAVDLLARHTQGGDLEARYYSIGALGQIANEEAVFQLLRAHFGSNSYVNHYLQRAARVTEQQTPQPAAGRERVDFKTPGIVLPIAPNDLGVRSEAIPNLGPIGEDYVYQRDAQRSWILWTEGRRDSVTRWSCLLYGTQSFDGGQTWSSPEGLLRSSDQLSHFQMAETPDDERVVLFARKRTIMSLRLGESSDGVEKPVPVGTEQSQVMKFNLVQRQEGDYLLFAAVGTPRPNDSLKSVSQLVVLASSDLVSWSSPVPIAPIEEGLGYFTVSAIPAVEMADGSILAGVGRKLYRSIDPLTAWETVWDGEEWVEGWISGVASILVDEDDAVHLGYRSSLYGYNDLFVTSSSDLIHWSPPIFTGIHDAIGTAVSSETTSAYLLSRSGQLIRLLHYEPTTGSIPSSGKVIRSTISLDELSQDSDQDGLADAIEARLLTDPALPDTDGDGKGDAEDRNPIAPAAPPGERDLIRQAVFNRLNHIDEDDPEPDGPGSLRIVVTDGETRQEFSGVAGVVLNLSQQEQLEYRKRFGHFGLYVQVIEITDYEEGSTTASVHSFTGHEGFSMTVKRLGQKWIVTERKATYRVY